MKSNKLSVRAIFAGCIVAMSLFLTACPAPGDGTVDGGETGAIETPADTGGG